MYFPRLFLRLIADMLGRIFSLLSFVAVVKGKGCQDVWIGYGDSCYLFIGTKEPWAQAGQVCASHGAALVTIETAEESTFVKGYVKVFGDLGADIYMWTGGNDMDIEGIWKWSPSGESVAFTDWASGEPSDDGDCIAIWKDLGYHWNDGPCTNKATFMCEKPKETDQVIG